MNVITEETMDDNENLMDSLLQKAVEFGKMSLELVKLKMVDTASDVVSSFVPLAVVIMLVFSCLMFISLGFAIWLGDILGNIVYGFFTVAAFFAVMGAFIHFFMHKLIKRAVRNFIIKLSLK